MDQINAVIYFAARTDVTYDEMKEFVNANYEEEDLIARMVQGRHNLMVN